MADNVVLRIDHNLRDTRQDVRGLNDEMGRNRQAFTELNKSAQQATQTMTAGAQQANTGFANLRSTLVGLATVGAFTALAKGIIDTTSRYEDLRTTLTTVEQSSAKAAVAFDMLNKLAAATPFSVESLTESYIKLRNRGLQPTERDLIALGDLAASQGKSLDQVTEAMLDALSGENERLKEFGIQASKAGDQVTFAFKGVQTTVAATPQAIQEAILSFGRMDGVAGGMAARSQTLSGQVSTLKDNLAQLAAGIGNAVLPMVKGFVGAVAGAVEWVGKLLGVSKDYAGATLEQQVNLAKGMNTLKSYNSLLASGTLSTEANNRVQQERRNVISELNAEFGPYLENQITEQTSLDELNRLYDIANKRLVENMTIKIKQQVLEEKINEANERAAMLIKARTGVLMDEASAFNSVVAVVNTRTAQSATESEFNKLLSDQYNGIIALQKELDKVGKGLHVTKEADTKATDKNAAATGKAADETKRLLDLQKRFAEQTKALEQANALANMEATETSAAQRRAIMEQELANELAGLDTSEINTEEAERRKQAIREKYAIEIDKLKGREVLTTKKKSKDQVTLAEETAKMVVDINRQLSDDLDGINRSASDRAFQHYAQKADEYAQLVGNLAQEMIGLFSALAAGNNAQQLASIDSTIAEVNDRIAASQEQVDFLNNAASQATGQRALELQQQANLRAATIDQERQKIEQLEARKKQLSIEQAKRDKAAALVGAVINTAQGVTKVLATTPTVDFGIARAILIATTIAAGAAQIATIAAQPLPQFRHGGEVGPGLLRGPRHSKGGIPIEAEGGEWIFSREKTQQFRPLFEAIQTGKVQPQQLQGTPNSQPRVDSSLAPLADALRNLKQVHVNLDAKGFRVAEQTAQRKTQYLNSRYHS